MAMVSSISKLPGSSVCQKCAHPLSEHYELKPHVCSHMVKCDCYGFSPLPGLVKPKVKKASEWHVSFSFNIPGQSRLGEHLSNSRVTATSADDAYTKAKEHMPPGTFKIGVTPIKRGDKDYSKSRYYTRHPSTGWPDKTA